MFLIWSNLNYSLPLLYRKRNNPDCSWKDGNAVNASLFFSPEWLPGKRYFTDLMASTSTCTLSIGMAL